MLEKIFIKNYKETTNLNVRNQYGIVAGIFGIVTNLLLSLIKLIIGTMSNSISIIADAINNVSDTISSILTIIGFKFSNKKPNENHPYGFARYEYIANLFISLFILIIGILFAQEGIKKIINPSELEINFIIYLSLTISIIIKLLQMFVYLRFAKIIESDTLKATAFDSRNDILSTLAILISMIFVNKTNINIDGYMALIVSIFVIISSIKLLKHAIDPLIGIKPTKKQIDIITNKIKSYKNIIGFHDLVIHNYGSNIDYITVHLEIDSDKSFKEAHEIADKIEENFEKELGYNITIHMDPVETNNPVFNDLKKEVIKKINYFDNNLKIHDFRIIKSNKIIKILFDCVIPYNKNYKSEEIENYLNNKIKFNKEKYIFIIKIDHDYY